MFGNGVVGILSETVNKWERRTPLTPSHCARLLHRGVSRIIVQPSTKRIHHDVLYEEVGCEISNDLSPCGLILGIKQPTVQFSCSPFVFYFYINFTVMYIMMMIMVMQLEMILPDRAYAFFSHTHKAQKENMPLLDKVCLRVCARFKHDYLWFLLAVASNLFNLVVDSC